MAEDRIYVNKSSAKLVEFPDGGSLMKISFGTAELIEFAQQHGNERGYLNLVVMKRREPGKFGDTHFIALDTYKPRSDAAPARPAQQPPPQQQSRPQQQPPQQQQRRAPSRTDW